MITTALSLFVVANIFTFSAGTLDPFAYAEKKSRPTYTSNNKPGASTSSDNPTKAEKPVATGAMQVKKAELPAELLDPLKASVLASKTTTRPLLIEEVFTALQKLPYKINKGMVDRAIGAIFDKKKKADVGMAPDGSEGCHWEIKKV